MDRARHAGLTALSTVIVFALALAPVGFGWRPVAVRAADVGWPVSSLLVSEVQTGGASASDEFVEIANQGAAAVDLNGLEVVYATSSGSTVTRKATWAASTMLEPGRRVLIANAGGIFAAGADLTYSGGFAATGGAVALRVVGGMAVDAVGWGDAVSGFVEGSAAPAPASGSSLERLPGGALGNTVDTNSNLADWLVQALPNPQGLSAPPVPADPDADPDPDRRPRPRRLPPTPTPTADPDADPDARRPRLRPRPRPPRRPRPRPPPRRLPRPRPRPHAADRRPRPRRRHRLPSVDTTIGDARHARGWCRGQRELACSRQHSVRSRPDGPGSSRMPPAASASTWMRRSSPRFRPVHRSAWSACSGPDTSNASFGSPRPTSRWARRPHCRYRRRSPRACSENRTKVFG